MKSLPDPSQNGTALQPSEQAAVAPSTPTAPESSKQTVIVLMAVLHALFPMILNEDVMAMAMMRARDTAKKAGVPEVEIERIMKTVERNWRAGRSTNPLRCLFDQ